jgi:uncharacterized protein (TIGR01244 family)
MPEFKNVTEEFAVSSQIRPADIAAAAERGFALIINNRPDGEAPDQPTSASLEAAARAAGLSYAHLPVIGRASPSQVVAMRAAIDAIDPGGGKTLAFCRSGTRSITTWALGQMASGRRGRDALLSLGARAGYDLSAALTS